MVAKGITPILNVSDMQQTFEWFEKLGWKKLWHWGEPPGFGAVGSGEVEIFLCHNCQGGRGRSTPPSAWGDDSTDRGMWVSMWVEDVDAVHRECLDRGIEVTFPPTDMEWNVREMHVMHPDGHVFRIGKGIEETEE